MRWAALGMVGFVTVAGAGDFKPMVQSNNKTLAKPETKKIDTAQWFPTNIHMVVSNKVFYFFPYADAYRFSKLNSKPQQIIQGGFLSCANQYRTYKFRIHSVSTNYVVLSIQGTMNQKKVPVTLLDYFE